jgi:hypothetical protein
LDFVYKKIATPQAGGFYAYKTQFLDKIPIKVSKDQLRVAYVAKVLNYMADINNPALFAFFEHLMNAMVYELYFPGEIKSFDCEVLNHLTDLPELKTDWSDQKKLSVIEKVCQDLSDPKHPVSIAMAKMQQIPEVKIIEGRA